MFHFGLRAAQDARSAPSVPEILVTGIRPEVVARQSAGHAGEKILPRAAYPEGRRRLGAFHVQPVGLALDPGARLAGILDECFPSDSPINELAGGNSSPRFLPKHVGIAASETRRSFTSLKVWESRASVMNCASPCS